MGQKRALAILGSPHSDGTTAAMLNHSICAAEKIVGFLLQQKYGLTGETQ